MTAERDQFMLWAKVAAPILAAHREWSECDPEKHDPVVYWDRLETIAADPEQMDALCKLGRCAITMGMMAITAGLSEAKANTGE